MEVVRLAPGTVPAPPAVSPTEAGLDDAALVSRAGELLAQVQQGCRHAPVDATGAVDTLVTQARHSAHPGVLARLLRAAAAVRLAADSPGAPLGQVDALLDELLGHAARHGLVLFEADGHAIAARLALVRGDEDAAMTAIASAMARLDEPLHPDAPLGEAEWQRTLHATYLGVAVVLTQLGVHELAEPILGRAERTALAAADGPALVLCGYHRIRLMLGWGLRLERAARISAAHQCLTAAAGVARMLATTAADADVPVGHHALLAAARALGEPAADPDAVAAELVRQLAGATCRDDRRLAQIALARARAAAGHPEEAVRDLTRAHGEVHAGDRTLHLALVRELGRLRAGLDPDGTATDVLRGYAAELESELWSTREARIAALRARVANERLRREHGAVAAQAMSDPLTGLPNRRALDTELADALHDPATLPLAVAVVDLDGFKDVNDRSSHARGDEVLRAVATALRNALRGGDLVARYGGDEFVVLLPRTPSQAAAAALVRAARAVARLPVGLARAVTLSAGVTSARAGEDTAALLERADAAMYAAKRRGGNQVFVGT